MSFFMPQLSKSTNEREISEHLKAQKPSPAGRPAHVSWQVSGRTK